MSEFPCCQGLVLSVRDQGPLVLNGAYHVAGMGATHCSGHDAYTLVQRERIIM